MLARVLYRRYDDFPPQIAIEILNEGTYYVDIWLCACLIVRLGRIGIAAQMVGLAQGAFDKAVPYTYQRHQFGQPVGTFQGMAFSIAQAAIDLEAARLMTYNAARRRDEGKSFTKEAAMAKYLASVVAQKVSGQAIEWAGGIGFTRETGIEKFWRDSKIVGYKHNPFIWAATKTWIGCNLRGNIKHPATDNRQIHSEGIFLMVLIRLVLYVRVLMYDRLGSLVLTILHILPIQLQNLLPYGRAGEKHHRRNRRYHCAEHIVKKVVILTNCTTNLPNSLECPKKALVPFLLANLYLRLEISSVFGRMELGEFGKTFMTSNGCVANVATAPAVAAEKLCTTAVFTPELGGIKRSARNINSRRTGQTEV